MNKLRISLFLVIFIIKAVTAKKLSGDELKHSVDSLLSAVDQLSAKSNMKLTARNIRSSTEMPNGNGMLYDVEVFDSKKIGHTCKIEVITLGNGVSKVVCTSD